MNNRNIIGLDKCKSSEVVRLLNKLLANYQIHYMNTRGYHWNIQGKEFFELHEKFEEVYLGLQGKIDELAERILTLGGTPNHSFSTYVGVSEIKEHLNARSGEECMERLQSGFDTLLHMQRVILAFSGDAEDEGTAALMGDYIREQEKLMWMFNAYNR